MPVGVTRRVLVAVALAAAACASGLAAAQAYPAKPIRWIVPFPPGGPADIVARLFAQKLAERVGQPAIVENRAGAGGNVGHDAVAKAPADGYTLGFVVPSIVTNVFQFKAALDPFRELAPVVHLDNASMVLVSSLQFPARTVAEVIAEIRAKPGAVSCGSSGALPTVGCEMLRAAAKADMIMVLYKGNAPALNAVMSGEINLLFDVVNTAAGTVRGGKARGIAKGSTRRGIAPLADLPLLSETVPDFELVTWHGVMVPRATSADLVARLNREFNAILQDPDVRQRLADQGLEATGGSPEVFESLLRSDFARYGKVLREAGVKPE